MKLRTLFILLLLSSVSSWAQDCDWTLANGVEIDSPSVSHLILDSSALAVSPVLCENAILHISVVSGEVQYGVWPSDTGSIATGNSSQLAVATGGSVILTSSTGSVVHVTMPDVFCGCQPFYIGDSSSSAEDTVSVSSDRIIETYLIDLTGRRLETWCRGAPYYEVSYYSSGRVKRRLLWRKY
jgi:hypothetical protein